MNSSNALMLTTGSPSTKLTRSSGLQPGLVGGRARHHVLDVRRRPLQHVRHEDDAVVPALPADHACPSSPACTRPSSPAARTRAWRSCRSSPPPRPCRPCPSPSPSASRRSSRRRGWRSSSRCRSGVFLISRPMMPSSSPLRVSSAPPAGAGVVGDRVHHVHVAGVRELEDAAPAGHLRVRRRRRPRCTLSSSSRMAISNVLLKAEHPVAGLRRAALHGRVEVEVVAGRGRSARRSSSRPP